MTINAPAPLSPADKQRLFQPLAQQVLARDYGFEGFRLEFLNHREGVTFRVHRRLDSADFHFRIHNPIPGRPDEWYQPNAIASILLWLEALDRDTDLTVQVPVRQRDGSLLSRLPAPGGDGQVTGALSRWIRGVGGNQTPGRTLVHIGRIGEVMARLHLHAATWETPADFVRPQWEPDQLEPSVAELERAARADKMEAQTFFALKQTAARALEHMRALERGPQTWGLIHGDLGHLGNCVYDRNEVWPIDFNDCAFGFFLYDIAHAFLYIASGERRAFLNGYQKHRSLPADFQPLIEGLMVAAQINLLARFAPHPHKKLDYAARFVARECTAFMRGRSFLFERSWWE